MALIPNAANRLKPARGIVGTWANMEEDNARTGFAGAEFPSAVPVMQGEGEMVYVPLEDGNRFNGIALRTVDMLGTPLEDGTATFRQNALFGIADMGVVFVLAGEGVTEGAVPYYDPETREYHGETGVGRLLLPTCEFDEDASPGEPVGLRIRVLPGAEPVTAAE